MVRKKQEVSRRETLLNELASECESPEEFMDLLQFFRSVANSFPASR